MINIPQKKELEDLINNEMTRAQIANIYKCSPSTVSLWFKKYNLKSKRIGGANNVKDLINQFEKITSLRLYKINLNNPKYNWLDKNIDDVIDKIKNYLITMEIVTI